MSKFGFLPAFGRTAIAFGFFFVASCGADTFDNLTFTPKSGCYGVCDKRTTCGIITSSALNGCQLSCDDGTRQPQRCTNEEAIWKAVRDNCVKDKSMCPATEKAGFEACVVAELAKCTM